MYVQFLHSNMYHMKTCMINHVKRNILPYTFLKQQLIKLHYTHLGDYWYLQAPHEAINISFILVLIMSSFADIFSIIFESMIGRLTHELNVSLRGENSHIFCTTCSNGRMGGDMATTATCLLYFEVGYEIDIHPLYNHGKIYDHVLIAHSAIYY